MSINHTQGPWEIQAMALEYMGQLVIMGPCPDQGQKVIANGAHNGKGNKTSFNDEQLANARLIAAAPELLDGLQRLMRHMPADFGGASFSDDWHKACAAIAKATTGEKK